MKTVLAWIAAQRWLLPVLLLAGLLFSFAIQRYDLVNKYIQMIMMYVGINIILTVSLNLVNGYMGEFSIGHAGFMAVGAYTAAILTKNFLPVADHPWLFPVAILAGGLVAALFGLIVAIPSFKTRGDYLALITLAFLMIIKSVIENIEYIGGPRGIPGVKKLTTLPWVYAWTIVSLWVIRNFIYSNYGRGVLSIREDEIASDLMSVNTRRVKFLAFSISSFFAGVAGGLFAHVLMFISPRIFDIIKSTDILIMVYMGGIASIGGSVIGAVVYTVLLEILRPSTVTSFFSFIFEHLPLPHDMAAWLTGDALTWLSEHVFAKLGVGRMVIMPLLLVLLMIYRPRGIMGLREWRWLIPYRDLMGMKKK